MYIFEAIYPNVVFMHIVGKRHVAVSRLFYWYTNQIILFLKYCTTVVSKRSFMFGIRNKRSHFLNKNESHECARVLVQCVQVVFYSTDEKKKNIAFFNEKSCTCCKLCTIICTRVINSVCPTEREGFFSYAFR